ncbi:hypothetical protein ACR782_01560 [Sphingobacterium spiritivorum]|uniref:hypothetical protein n=1 Tax=Sphingobacterium spiritivorum TaxID=258 RepID=UPI003DA262E4
MLDLAGIKARHNLRERLFVSGVSYAIMATTVYTIKSTGNVWRPDNSANNSFPSDMLLQHLPEQNYYGRSIKTNPSGMELQGIQ